MHAHLAAVCRTHYCANAYSLFREMAAQLEALLARQLGGDPRDDPASPDYGRVAELERLFEEKREESIAQLERQGLGVPPSISGSFTAATTTATTAASTTDASASVSKASASTSRSAEGK